MVASEVVAIKKLKNKASPNASTVAHLIPFRHLNVIFAFGILVRVLLETIQTTKLGIPGLSIQTDAMLLCLLLTNNEAKDHIKTKWKSCTRKNENQVWTIELNNLTL